MATSSGASGNEPVNLAGGSEPDSTPEDFPNPKSSQSLVVQSLQRSTQYEFHNIVGWLQLVDDNLDKHSSIQLLHLGAKSEIGTGTVEHCKRPSDFYHLLRQTSSSDAQALARFTYALQGLGKYGKYCNRQFTKKVKTEPPSTEEHGWRAKNERCFGFHQCLVEICVSLRDDPNVYKRFKRYIYHSVLVRRSQDQTVAKLFLRMLEKSVISEENQDQLALALDTVGATAGLVVLQHFRSQFNLPAIEVENLTPVPREDDISEPPTTTSPSPFSSVNGATSGSRSNNSRPSTPGNLADRENPSDHELRRVRLSRFHPHHEVEEERTVTEVTRLIGGPPSATRGNYSLDTQPIHPVPQQPEVNVLPAPNRQPPQGNRYRWKCLLGTIFTVVFILSAGAGLSMIVLASIESSSIVPHTTVYENTNVALGNIQKFTTRRVTLFQDPGNDEVYIPLTIYRASGSCGSLPTIPGPETNISVPLQPHTVIFRNYLMPESVLNYTICAVTNQLNGNKYHIGLYLAEELDENHHFDPENSPNHIVPLAYSGDLQPNNKCYSTITLTITKRGPYSVVLFLPSEVSSSNISLWYSQNNHLRIIDTSDLTQECTLNSRGDVCSISVGSLQHYISVFCVVVKVGDSNYGRFTSVRSSLAESDIGKIWFYVVGGFTITLISCVFILFVALMCWCSRRS